MGPCECKDYEFRGNKLVCKRCGKEMKSQRKEYSNKARRHNKNLKGKEREE